MVRATFSRRRRRRCNRTGRWFKDIVPRRPSTTGRPGSTVVVAAAAAVAVAVAAAGAGQKMRAARARPDQCTSNRSSRRSTGRVHETRRNRCEHECARSSPDRVSLSAAVGRALCNGSSSSSPILVLGGALQCFFFFFFSVGAVRSDPIRSRNVPFSDVPGSPQNRNITTRYQVCVRPQSFIIV